MNRVLAAWGMWAKVGPSGVLDHPSRIFLLDPRGHQREIYNLQFLSPRRSSRTSRRSSPRGWTPEPRTGKRSHLDRRRDGPGPAGLRDPQPGGRRLRAADVREALRRHFPGDGTYCEIHETTPDDRIAELVDAARRRGFDLVVAAGGDGTVAAVADGLVGAEAALGILPIGTANVIARDLGVPLDLDGACGLLAGPHAIERLDAMRVGDRYFLTQIGVGIDALMIRDTKREHKRRFGRIAYLWTAFTRLLGFQPRRFFLEADGRRTRHRASQVLVANGGILGQPPFRWGPGIRPDDGRLDVCVIRARTLLDYLRLPGTS